MHSLRGMPYSARRVTSVRERDRLHHAGGTQQADLSRGAGALPELQRAYRTEHIGVRCWLAWYEAVRADASADWPKVTYYLMGANEWRIAEQWPPARRGLRRSIRDGGTLTASSAHREMPSTIITPTIRRIRRPPWVGTSCLTRIRPEASM